MKSSLRNEERRNNTGSKDYLDSVKNKLDLEQRELLNQYESSFLHSNTLGIPERYNYIEANKPYIMEADHNEEFTALNKGWVRELIYLIILVCILCMVKKYT